MNRVITNLRSLVSIALFWQLASYLCSSLLSFEPVRRKRRVPSRVLLCRRRINPLHLVVTASYPGTQPYAQPNFSEGSFAHPFFPLAFSPCRQSFLAVSSAVYFQGDPQSQMSVMAKMNGNQGHGKPATNIWQVMNYQVPRGYVLQPLYSIPLTSSHSLHFIPFTSVVEVVGRG